jgi:hypothetical protein
MCIYERACQKFAHNGRAHHGLWMGRCRWHVYLRKSKLHLLTTMTGIIQALFPGLNYISSLCIAACLTPTDPVTCAAITR